MNDDPPRCARCARPISSLISLVTGFGSDCRRNHADPAKISAALARALAAARPASTGRASA